MNPTPHQLPTGIEVRLEFFPLAFMLLFTRPRVEIDGIAHQAAWGTHLFPLQPGWHQVRIYFPYFFQSNCGENGAYVYVWPGQITRMHFYMPPLMLVPGSLSVSPTEARRDLPRPQAMRAASGLPCPRCGLILVPGSRACPGCGQRLA